MKKKSGFSRFFVDRLRPPRRGGKAVMRALGHKLKIRNLVVCAIAVLMVNNFAAAEAATEVPFHDQSVLGDAAARGVIDNSVSVCVNVPPFEVPVVLAVVTGDIAQCNRAVTKLGETSFAQRRVAEGAIFFRGQAMRRAKVRCGYLHRALKAAQGAANFVIHVHTVKLLFRKLAA